MKMILAPATLESAHSRSADILERGQPRADPGCATVDCRTPPGVIRTAPETRI